MAGRPKYSRGIGEPTAPRGEFTGDLKKETVPFVVPPLTNRIRHLCNKKYECELITMGLQVYTPDHPNFENAFNEQAAQIRIVQINLIEPHLY
jgi:hypothetical protein